MGFFYEKLSYVITTHAYTFHDDKLGKYVFSHLVFISKFTMPPTAHIMKGNFATFQLKINILKIILHELEEDTPLGQQLNVQLLCTYLH